MDCYEAVLLDVDGTLVESNDQQAYAWCEALQNLGYAVGFTLLAPMIGMTGEALVPLVTGLPQGGPTVREIINEQRRIFQTRYLHTLRPTPGARALLERLHDDGLLVVAATIGTLGNMRDVLDQVGLLSFVDALAAAEDDGAAADPYGVVGAALRKVQTIAARAILIGDSPYDLAAAKRADVEFVGLRCGGFSDDLLEGASAIFDHPRALARALNEMTFSQLLASSRASAASERRPRHVAMEQHLHS